MRIDVKGTELKHLSRCKAKTKKGTYFVVVSEECVSVLFFKTNIVMFIKYKVAFLLY